MALHTGAYCRAGAAGPTEVGCDQHWANSHKRTINSSLSEHIRLCSVASDGGEHRRVKNKETKVVWMLIFILKGINRFHYPLPKASATVSAG